MQLVRFLRLRARSLFRRGTVDEELDEEIRHHFEQEIAFHRAAGLTPEAARQAAARAFGHVPSIRDRSRDMRRVGWIEDASRDIVYALRSMRRSPGATAVVIASLTVAIGANTAVFSLVDLLMLRSLNVSAPERLVEFARAASDTPANFSFPLYERVRDQTRTFAGVLAMSAGAVEATLEGAERQPVGRFVSGNFFELLGVGPSAGRLITPADERPSADAAVAVISYRLWQRQFGGSPDVIGRVFKVSTAAFTIVGVMPPTFNGLIQGKTDDFLIPLAAEPLARRFSLLGSAGANWLKIVGRLGPGTSAEAAKAELEVIWLRFVDEYAQRASDPQRAQELRAQRLDVIPARAGLSDLRQQFSQPVLLLMGAVSFVLLIACANIVNLLLARGTARRRELGVRLAIGASRARLVRQQLTESAVLGTIGGGAGLALAAWGTSSIARIIADSDPAIAFDAAPDVRVVLFTAALALLSAVLAAVVPALRQAGIDAAPALHEDQRTLNTGPAVGRSTRLLIGAQVALSLLLLAGASLLITTLRNLRTADAGFDHENVIVATVNPESVGYFDERRHQYYRQMLAGARETPGVRGAGLAFITPISGSGLDFSFGPLDQPEERHTAVYVNVVSEGYFAALGTRILAGRDFSAADTPNSPAVIIINDALARRYFAQQDALGQRVRLGSQPSLEVIGVVANAKYLSLRDDDAPTAYIYAFQQNEPLGLTLTVRTAGDPQAVVPILRRRIQTVAPAVPVPSIATLTSHVERSLVKERLVMQILAAFAVLALLLVSVGLYGILAHWVVRRTSEIGVRLAIGATRRTILRLVLRESATPVGLGILVGIPATVMVSRLLTSLLYGVTPADPLVLGGVVVSLMCVAGAAAAIPAWRACRVDPLVALRQE